MARRLTTMVILIVTTVLTGCASPRPDASWPRARGLGEDVSAYQPSAEMDRYAWGAKEVEQPTGELSLRQALALALLGNPGLPAFTWELRSAEARAFQAERFPNPELEAEIEEFAGSGELSGFDAAEYTVLLSQEFQLGRKRAKVTRLALLERELAGWDYESKRLDVFTKVRQAFVELLAAQERLSLSHASVDLSEQLLRAAEKRVESGATSSVEKTKAEIELSAGRIEWKRAERALDVARKNLAATWGSPSASFTSAVGEMKRLTRVCHPPKNSLADCRRIPTSPVGPTRWNSVKQQWPPRRQGAFRM